MVVRMLRLASGLTIWDVSKRTGIAASRLSLIERGLEIASEQDVRRIAEAIPGFAEHSESLMDPVDPQKLAEALR